MLGIVLQRRDFREFDQIITLYTKETGKREALARGVKKLVSKNAAFLEPCAVADVEIIHGKEIDHVTTAQPTGLFTALRSDLGKMMAASYAVKLLDQVIAVEQPDERIFNLLREFLEFINTAPVVTTLIIPALALRLFGYLGFAPKLAECERCGKDIPPGADAIFDIAGGGLLGRNCEPAGQAGGHPTLLPLTATALAHLRVLSSAPWAEINVIVPAPADHKTINALAYQFVLYHSAQKISSWQLVEQMAS